METRERSRAPPSVHCQAIAPGPQPDPLEQWSCHIGVELLKGGDELL